MVEKLNNHDNLIDLINNFSDYSELYKNYQKNILNLVAFLWLLLLSTVATLGLIFPVLDLYLGLGLVILSIFMYKQVNKLGEFLMNIYLNKINKRLGDKINFYKNNSHLVRKAIQETLNEGTDNYLEMVINKINKREAELVE